MAVSGYARPLADGFLMTWIAPVNCKSAQRKVVWGQLLRSDGQPASPSMAIGDADGHAVSTRENDMEMWLRRDNAIVWLSAQCGKP
jgi:hypothetical protein